MSSEAPESGKVREGFKTLSDFASANTSITLIIVTTICTLLTKLSVGSTTSDSISEAMGTMATSLNDEVEWRRNAQRYRQMQKAQIETSAPLVAIDYLNDTILPMAQTSLLGFAGAATGAAKHLVGWQG